MDVMSGVNVEFVPYDPLYWEKELISNYQSLAERELFPADPERVIIDIMTYALAIIHFNINEAAKQNLLCCAEGDKLDALAEFYGVKRLPARPARVTIRFSIAEPMPFDIVIPKGTRVAPSGSSEIFFATLSEVKIEAGETSAEVQAECNISGTAGNGFAIGQINQILDPLPYEVSAENVTMSMYGADEEDDERFRERIRLSIERFSNAGSRGAYKFHIKTAHQDIEDVEVFSPAPGQVKAVFLLKDGKLPDDSMINLVVDYVSSDKIKPLTDKFSASAPSVVEYDIDLRYYIHRKDESLVAQIQEKVERAVRDFISWTGRKIGRDVLPEELITRVKDAGAYKVEVNEPQRIEITKEQVAKAKEVKITYAGLCDD